MTAAHQEERVERAAYGEEEEYLRHEGGPFAPAHVLETIGAVVIGDLVDQGKVEGQGQ